MKKPVVLGLVSYTVFPARVGGQQCVEGFYRALAQQATVILAVAKKNETDSVPQARVLNFLFDHWLGPLNLFFLFRLIKLIRRNQVDIIITEHSYFGWLGWLLQLSTGKPFVIRSHNIEALRFRDIQRWWWRLYAWYEGWIHRKARCSYFITAEDRDYAITHWSLSPDRCALLRYGTLETHPPAYQRSQYRSHLLKIYGLAPHTRLFLFNGSLNYSPNTDALRVIVHELVPGLRKQGVLFRIFIAGSDLSPAWEQVLKEQPEIIVLGWVDDLIPYLRGIDCTINPVTLGGGIKTKLVEALCQHQRVITTASGARGLLDIDTGAMLTIIPDYQWHQFAYAMQQLDIYTQPQTPAAFLEASNWTNIVQKAHVSLSAL